MNSTQPTTTEEKTVTTGVVILALLASALGLGLVKCGNPSKQLDAVEADLNGSSSLAEHEGSLPEGGEFSLEDLTLEREKNAKLQAEFEDLEGKYAGLNEKLSKAIAQNKKNQLNQATASAATSEGATSDLAASAVGVGAVAAGSLSNSQNKVEDLARLAEIKDLQGQLDKAKAEIASLQAKDADQAVDAEAQEKYLRVRNANEELQRKNTDLEELVARLKSEQPEQGTGDAQLESALKKNNDEWQGKLNDALRKAELEKAERIAALEGKIRELELAGGAKDAPVFAKSQKDLPFVAQQLFGELKNIETMKSPDLDKVYQVIQRKSKGVSKGRVKFASGVTTPGPKGRKQVSDTASLIGEDSMVLVVGFADKSGDSKANEQLSSARAKAVAAGLKSQLSGNQQIKAVYLGETERFGPKKENRVVEIWEIAR